MKGKNKMRLEKIKKYTKKGNKAYILKIAHF